MRKLSVLVPISVLVLACATGSTDSFGEDGSGGSGGAPGATSSGKTTGATTKATTAASTTVGTTAVNTTAANTSANVATSSSAQSSAASGGMCGPSEFPCGDGGCFDLFLELCNGSPDCANGFDENPSVCGGGMGWTCDPAFYDALDGCDCGCGITDPDCPSMSASVCDYCDDPGSCSQQIGCPGDIDPNDNSQCI